MTSLDTADDRGGIMKQDRFGDPAVKLIRVLVAEDLTLLRTTLTTVLSTEVDIDVLAAISCDEQITATIADQDIDVAIVGVDTMAGNCLTTLKAIGRQWPRCRIVALTTSHATDVSAQLLAAAVDAIVDKYTSTSHLLTVVRAVAGGDTVIPAKYADAARAAIQNPLTVREQQVLRLAANGATAPEIARELRLTQGTVRNYISSAMTKTQAHTRIDAILAARRYGWL
jgi:two-component system, NarL family, response regulator DesR